MDRILTGAVALGGAVLLSSCSVAPDYERPDVVLPAVFFGQMQGADAKAGIGGEIDTAAVPEAGVGTSQGKGKGAGKGAGKLGGIRDVQSPGHPPIIGPGRRAAPALVAGSGAHAGRRATDRLRRASSYKLAVGVGRFPVQVAASGGAAFPARPRLQRTSGWPVAAETQRPSRPSAKGPARVQSAEAADSGAVGAATKGADVAPLSAGLPEPTSRWWRAFGIAELDRLEDAALVGNQDLSAAAARIVRARALAEAQGAALLPTIQGTGRSERRSLQGGGTPLKNTTADDRRGDFTYQMGVQASYDIDLWGKTQSGLEAALAGAEQSAFTREALALTLTGDVGLTYFQYLAFKSRLAVADGNIRNMRKVLETVAGRAEIGEGNDLELAQQRSLLAQAEATAPAIAMQMEQAANRLALLTGQTIISLKLNGPAIKEVVVPAVAAGVPSQLLQRRADIRAAEAALMAANANIGVARAALFPGFALTGQYGIGSTMLSVMLSPAGAFYSVGANIVQTIFDNGKSRRELDAARASHEELVYGYKRAVLTAFHDVENALSAVAWTARQARAQERSVQYAREAYDLSGQALEIGMIDMLTILDSQRTLNREEDLEVQARLAQLTAAVDLFKAIGGDLGSVGASGGEAARVAHDSGPFADRRTTDEPKVDGKAARESGVPLAPSRTAAASGRDRVPDTGGPVLARALSVKPVASVASVPAVPAVPAVTPAVPVASVAAVPEEEEATPMPDAVRSRPRQQAVWVKHME